MLIQIKHRYTLETIFEYDCEGNSFKLTVLCALKAKVSLSGADMRNANMSGANMRNADMNGADMNGANMSYADMNGANMSYANMSYANMRNANMSGADMNGANMSGANMNYADMSRADMWNTIGNMAELRSFQLETYCVCFSKDTMQIGCERFLIEEWRSFDDATINSMGFEALTFWKKWRDFIFLSIDLCFKP